MKLFTSNILSVILVCFLFSCQNEIKTDQPSNPETIIDQNPDEPTRVLPAILSRALKVHDPEGKWDKMNTMEFTLNVGTEKEQHHLVNLKNRKVRIDANDYQVGFDGNDVWVAPNKEAYGKGSARFYHNLYFYFFAMPYVLTDPGINYKVLPPKKLGDNIYNAVSITYQSNVGDAPDDEYIACFNQETNRMEALLYTVTYGGDGPSDKYGCRLYSKWQEVNGIWLPKTNVRYKYTDGDLGEKGSEQEFTDVKLSEEAPDAKLFEKPEIAEIDPVK